MKKAWLVCAFALVGACTEDKAVSEADGGGPDGGQPDAGEQDSCAAQTARLSAFVATHNACASDSDCAGVGTCSSGPDVVAVNRASREEAEQLLDAVSCPVQYDGPNVHVLCEQGTCVARRTGDYCNSISGPCPRSQEQYGLASDVDGGSAGFCAQHCAASVDGGGCASGFACEPTSVLSSAGASAAVQLSLCRPAPSCEVLLSLDSAGARWRSVLAAGASTPVSIELWAENRTSAPKTFTYRRPCPGGPSILGLPDGFDAWGTCLAGVCADANPITTVQLAANERVSLGSVSLTVAPSACNPSGLPSGQYPVRFALSEVAGASVCGPEALDLSVR